MFKNCRLIYGLVFIAGLFCTADKLTAKNTVNDFEALNFIKNTWKITEISDTLLSETLDIGYNGIPYREWITLIIRTPEFMKSIAEGEYKNAADQASNMLGALATGIGLKSMGLAGIAAPAKLAALSFEMTMKGLIKAGEDAKFKIQAYRYFQIRPNHSYQEIISHRFTGPFEGKDKHDYYQNLGPNISENNRMWFYRGGEKVGYPNMKASDFFEYMEQQWLAKQAFEASFEKDNQFIKNQFLQSAMLRETKVETSGLDQWVPKAPFTENMIAYARYGNNVFIALEYNPSSQPHIRILRSVNGTEWTGTAVEHDIERITYGNGTFVAVGYDGVILSSDDGKEWIRRDAELPERNRFLDVTYGKNMFVAIGAGVIFTSPDGKRWQEVKHQYHNHVMSRITYGNNMFLVAGLVPHDELKTGHDIITSTDGKSWRRRNVSLSPQQMAKEFYVLDILTLAFGNNVFVASMVAENALATKSYMLSSGNGTEWNITEPPRRIIDITYAENTFVAVGHRGTLLTSTDGVTWTARDSGTASALLGITYGAGRFVAVGDQGTILHSTHVEILKTSKTGKFQQ